MYQFVGEHYYDLGYNDDITYLVPVYLVFQKDNEIKFVKYRTFEFHIIKKVIDFMYSDGCFSKSLEEWELITHENKRSREKTYDKTIS